MDFKIGDRVFIHTDYESGGIEGMYGTIVHLSRHPDNVHAIRLDQEFDNGHSCGGRVPDGYGWWVNEEYFELAENQIVIIPSGNPIIDRSQKLWNRSKYGKTHSFLVQTT